MCALALSRGRYSIFGAIALKNRKKLKSWDFLNPETYFGPLQSLLIISAKFLYKKCDKLAKVPTRVKLGVFLGIWKIGCTASVLRFKKFSYMPVLMSQGGVFHRGVKPPNSEKVYHKCFVAGGLPHLKGTSGLNGRRKRSRPLLTARACRTGRQLKISF